MMVTSRPKVKMLFRVGSFRTSSKILGSMSYDMFIST